MRVAYADPPYLGESKRLYGDHPEAGVYDTIEGHAALIRRLCDEFPDGWALSLHSPSLRAILPLCPKDVRVMAWVKPWASWKPNVNPGYCWEPVIIRGGRKRTRWQDKVRDYVSANAICMKRLPGDTMGRKPEAFCFWLFDVLNLQPGDELVDLFPGSDAVTRAWDAWKRQRRLPLREARP